MSIVAVRKALEVRLKALSPALATAWENEAFNPPGASTPYQRVSLLPARPDNPEQGGGFYREQGILQISLCYPRGKGTKAAGDRAEALRAHFPRALSLTADGVVVTIENTPAVAPHLIDADRYVVPVSVRWFANIQG